VKHGGTYYAGIATAGYRPVVRWLALVLLGGVAVAAPSKPVRKPPPPELPANRLSDYVDAVIADKLGDFEKAIQRYQSAADGKPLAAIVYNIADLERRSEDYEEAVRDYKKYLELAPQAADRGAVQQLIQQLEKTPMTLVVDGEDLDAVVFIDGKRAGASPLVTTLATGSHTMDRIGPTRYRHDYLDAKPMKKDHITDNGSEEKGNVILSTSTTYGGSWTDKDVTYMMNRRFELPPGKYETPFFEAGRACSPLSFTVPATGLVYVFIDAPRDFGKRGPCVPIKVTTQNLPFGRGAK
jgi:tetratricopeptide (TPR) repeat protein